MTVTTSVTLQRAARFFQGQEDEGGTDLPLSLAGGGGGGEPGLGGWKGHD